MSRQGLPIFAAIFGIPEVATGRPHHQSLAVAGNIQAVSVYLVIAMGLRQARAQRLEAGTTIFGAVHHQRLSTGIRQSSLTAGTNQASGYRAGPEIAIRTVFENPD